MRMHLYFPIVSAAQVMNNDAFIEGEPRAPRVNFYCMGLAMAGFAKLSRYIFMYETERYAARGLDARCRLVFRVCLVA